jgi:hypothetical protein
MRNEMQTSVATTATADDLLIRDPIVLRDGGFHLALGGELVPLLMQGDMVPYFLPGWRASHLYTGFAPLFLLELVHDDGRTATWFLDQRMERMADAVDRLTPELIDLLRQKAVPVLAKLLHTTLHQCRPVLDRESLAFLSINETTRRAVAVNCLDRVLHPPRSFLAEHLMASSLLFRGENDGSLRAISRTHLAAGLAADFQDRLAAAFRDGVFAWPSPVDGTELQAQGCFCFDDFHFAYRFADLRHGLVFFVMVADHYSRIGGVWFPSLGLLVSHDEITRGVGRYTLRHIPYWFTVHSCLWAELLVPYLRRGASRFASVMRGRPGVHIGHQLWNELSGIDHLLEGRPEVLPEWIVLNASDGIELYGPVDELFPALQGRVNRALPNIPSLIHYAYASGLMILRVTREHVSARLRDRILERVRVGAAHAEARALIGPGRRKRKSQKAAPAILLGLRVENRTLVDLGAFYENLVGSIVQRFPNAVIVLDGHNARGDAGGGKVIESHGEPAAARKPVEIERDLAAMLRERFGSSPVTIVDTIGQPIDTSLAWADSCDCFVSIWGASLAKYRWVCNKTGFIITSRDNLLRRGDLHIYDAERFMEAPTPVRFIDAELAQDDPAAPLLVNVAPGNASFFNFRVDEARLFPQIGDMIEQSMTARAPA